jgi:hypothetical protein
MEEQTQQETKQKEKKEELVLQRLKIKNQRLETFQFKKRYAFTHGGKTKKS